MKLVYFLILLILIGSCTQTMEIKTSGAEKVVKDAYIRTAEIDVYRENQQIDKEPKIDIISPRDNEIIKERTLIIKLNISNFKLVTPDRYPKEGQGHIQVWVDDMEARSSNTEFIFENETNGTHVIKAELMLSNNTVLPYSKTIKIFIPP